MPPYPPPTALEAALLSASLGVEPLPSPPSACGALRLSSFQAGLEWGMGWSAELEGLVVVDLSGHKMLELCELESD